LGVALLLALVATPLAAAWGRRRGIVDRPGPRRWHRGAIPRTGGIALFVAFVAAILLAQWLPVPRQDPKELIRLLGIVAGSTFLLVVGYLDDRFELSPGPQYLAQVIAALIAVLCLVFIERVMNPFTDQITVFPYPFVVVFTLLWIVGMINTINFLDGLDGLAAGVGAIVSAVLAIHMLREGQYSVALGAKLALLLLVLSIPIVDVAWLMISRLRSGQSFAQADRRHLHFRLLDLGLGPRQVVLLYYVYCITLGAVALLIRSRLLKLATLVIIGAATLAFLAWLAQRTLPQPTDKAG